MDKDYKDRVADGGSGPSAPPGWLWFLSGVLAGGFFAGLVCLKTGSMNPLGGGPASATKAAVGQVVASQPSTATTPGPQEKPPVVKVAVQPPRPPVNVVKPPPSGPAQQTNPVKPKIPEPRFDFYTILPEKEEVVANKQASRVVVQDRVSPTIPMNDGIPPINSVAEGEPQYMLQLGSFKRLEDAERRRSELGLRSIQAEIQTVTINDGDVYHRVRSGPYSSEDAGLLGEKLREININSLTIRLRSAE